MIRVTFTRPIRSDTIIIINSYMAKKAYAIMRVYMFKCYGFFLRLNLPSGCGVGFFRKGVAYDFILHKRTCSSRLLHDSYSPKYFFWSPWPFRWFICWSRDLKSTIVGHYVVASKATIVGHYTTRNKGLKQYLIEIKGSINVFRFWFCCWYLCSIGI